MVQLTSTRIAWIPIVPRCSMANSTASSAASRRARSAQHQSEHAIDHGVFDTTSRQAPMSVLYRRESGVTETPPEVVRCPVGFGGLTGSADLARLVTAPWGEAAHRVVSAFWGTAAAVGVDWSSRSRNGTYASDHLRVRTRAWWSVRTHGSERCRACAGPGAAFGPERRSNSRASPGRHLVVSSGAVGRPDRYGTPPQTGGLRFGSGWCRRVRERSPTTC